MKLQSLTNVRPTKDLGTQVIASCTKGQFKVTPDAAKKLKVVAGDYLDILQDVETEKLYVTVGSKGNGGKLAGDGSLTFSAAVAWNQSEADEDHNTHYDLGEAVTEGEGEEAKTYYPLEFVEKEPKMQRTSKEDKGEEVADAQASAPADASADEASFNEL